jgi:hypothetical protein
MPDQPSRHRRFQFRLWTLFVVTTIAAVQCAVCLPPLRDWQQNQRGDPIYLPPLQVRWNISLSFPQPPVEWRSSGSQFWQTTVQQKTPPATKP